MLRKFYLFCNSNWCNFLLHNLRNKFCKCFKEIKGSIKCLQALDHLMNLKTFFNIGKGIILSSKGQQKQDILLFKASISSDAGVFNLGGHFHIRFLFMSYLRKSSLSPYYPTRNIISSLLYLLFFRNVQQITNGIKF